jgi:GNAT superfamily N-acetyltransferase
MSHQVYAALASGRRSQLLEEAEHARLTRRARQRNREARRLRAGEHVRLPDGSRVVIRPLRTDDAPLLTDTFNRLSAESRRLRFLTGKKRLSQADLRYLTDVDGFDHAALAALTHARGHGVGVARYVRDAQDPMSAEIAVTVLDDWQGRGLGTHLLRRLAGRARTAGIRRFTALVARENDAMIGLLHNVSDDVDLVSAEFDTLELRAELVCAEGGRRRSSAL